MFIFLQNVYLFAILIDNKNIKNQVFGKQLALFYTI